MNVGQVYAWETTKAKGYDYRKKMHIFICEADWEVENVFLFISSINYEGDFLIPAAAYKFLSYDSYVACHSIVTYSDDELSQFAPVLVGYLLPRDIKALHRKVSASEVLEGRHIRRICTALQKAF
jgi:hypothetical protein